MEPMSIPSIVAATPAAKRVELKKAVCDLRDRGLFKAAAWAAEQLMGLPDTDQSSQGPSSRRRPGEGAPGPSATPPEEEDEDSFLLARSCFDLKVILQIVINLWQDYKVQRLYLYSSVT